MWDSLEENEASRWFSVTPVSRATTRLCKGGEARGRVAGGPSRVLHRMCFPVGFSLCPPWVLQRLSPDYQKVKKKRKLRKKATEKQKM